MWGDVLPGCWESADSGEEHRRLDIDMDSQRQLPVVAFHFPCSPGVLEVKHCFQSLHINKMRHTMFRSSPSNNTKIKKLKKTIQRGIEWV